MTTQSLSKRKLLPTNGALMRLGLHRRSTVAHFQPFVTSAVAPQSLKRLERLVTCLAAKQPVRF
ncbi:hypothetical protein HanIR_Chr11g0529391 [Helianthus annuus]|nr:hypothetical protein HanIR_Chr11g0529391 [Helianthus annuus]